MKPKRTINLPRFRGGPLQLLMNHDHEVVLSGGSDIGKTWAACVKSLILCTDPDRPNVHGCMVRKTFKSIRESGARTFNTITQGMGIKRFGGAQYTDKWVFPNGSELVCAGLDTPERLLGSEWDFVQVIQAEQLTENEWEIIASRCTGRGAIVAYPQIFADCNPGGSKHWLRTRKSVTMINSTHKDNPALYDDAGNETPEGTKRIGFLKSTLTGVRRKRLLEGIWATAEGAVYDMFDSTPGRHVITRNPLEMARWFLAIDDGFTNPAAILLIGADTDGRWHVFREYYQSGVLQEKVCKEAQRWNLDPLKEFGIEGTGKVVELCGVDEAAAGLIASLQSLGINAQAGKGRILDGIRGIQDRLAFQADGLARLTVDPSCVETINEFESYVWKPEKDIPVDKDNHALGALRYLQDALGEVKSFDEANIKGVSTGGLAQAAGLEQPRIFVPRTFTPTRGR
jgi:PBSX family phage terminase large subunit